MKESESDLFMPTGSCKLHLPPLGPERAQVTGSQCTCPSRHLIFPTGLSSNDHRPLQSPGQEINPHQPIAFKLITFSQFAGPYLISQLSSLLISFNSL